MSLGKKVGKDMQSKVGIKECHTYDVHQLYESLQDLFRFLGGIERFIQPGDKVLLKVNLTGPFEPKQGATTHPALVQAIVKILKEQGACPVIADGPATILSPLEITGMNEVAKEEDVAAYILKDYEPVINEGNLIVEKIMYSSDVLKADKVITIPKLKTHALTLFTGAIKNSFGSVAYEQRKSLHAYRRIEEFSKVLVDVFRIRVPDLCIIDGILGIDGIGPVHGNPNYYNVLLASSDPVAIDTVGATLLGYNAQDILMIQEAAKLNLGENDISKIIFNCDHKEFITKKPNIIPHFTGTRRENFIRHVMGKVEFNETKCVKCGECQNGCPGNAIILFPEQKVDEKLCLHCLRCYEVCHRGAVRINYKRL